MGAGVVGIETIGLAAEVTGRVEPQLDTKARESARDRWRRFVQAAVMMEEVTAGSRSPVS
jgi:hypothetical protein